MSVIVLVSPKEVKNKSVVNAGSDLVLEVIMLHQLYHSPISPCYVYGLLVDVGDSFGVSEGDEVTWNRSHPAQPVQGVRLLQGDDNHPDERVTDLRPKLKKITTVVYSCNLPP